MHWVEVLQWYGHHQVDDNALLPLRAEDKMISSNDEIGTVFRIHKLKVAPYSFLTARELVSKSRDGASFKKSTRKSRAT